MNQIPIYQHPFVDVFKATKLTEWTLSHKEGEVTEVYDKELTKNVIKVSGITPASNYFQLPAQKHLPKKSLGLTGKYVYMTINVPAGKSFVVHFDYTVNETRLVRLSISNIYKEFKNLNGNSLQIPISLPYQKWTMICVNTYQLLEQNQVFIPSQPHSFFLRSLQVTANLMVKGIYTSDIKYTIQTLPKDMSMKLTSKDKSDWFASYAWIDYPNDQQEQAQDQMHMAQNKEQKNSENDSKENNKNKINKTKTTKVLTKQKGLNKKSTQDDEEEVKQRDLNGQRDGIVQLKERPKSIIRATQAANDSKSASSKSVKFTDETKANPKSDNKALIA